MQTLYVLSVISFLALAWAAFAITRHIRRSASTSREASMPVQASPGSDSRQELPAVSRARKEPIPFPTPIDSLDSREHPKGHVSRDGNRQSRRRLS